MQDRSWEMVFTSFVASLSPPPPGALSSRPVGACFQLFVYQIKNRYCLFPLEKDPGGVGAKVVPFTKQLDEVDQSG